MINTFFLSTLNHLLKPSGWARDRLAPHAGRTALLRLTPLEIRFSITDEGYLTRWSGDGGTQADAILTLPLADLLPPPGDARELMQKARVEGPAELAEALGFVFRHLRWDTEEDLSRFMGDIAARRAMLAARSFGQAPGRLWDRVSGNLADYFSEDEAFLLNRTACGSLSGDIAGLAETLDRLDGRIRCLEAPRARALPTT